MRTKKTAWYDKENDKVLFGVKVLVDGGWANLAIEGKPFLVETETECEQKRKELRRRK